MAGDNKNNFSGEPLFDLGTNSSDRAMADIIYRAMRRAMHDEGQSSNRFKPTEQSQGFFNDRKNEMQYGHNSRFEKSKDYRRTGNSFKDFTQGIEDQMLDALVGGDFKKNMRSALNTFTKEFGFELKDLPHELGKTIGKQILSTEQGKKINANLSKQAEKYLGKIFDKGGADGAAAKKALSNVMNSLLGTGSEVAEGAAGAGDALAGLGAAASSAAAVLLPLVVVFALLKPALEGLTEVAKSLATSATKQEAVRKKASENAQKRLEADMKYMAEQPFNILMDAAKRWEQTWDANLAKVALTQGYTKEDTYDLYESIASRLISEGLGSSIAATDVINNLGSILESGLSGKVAEEFAYISTKLSSAIPTENFTGYAATYAQLASDAIAKGMTESEALQYANEQLETFASNLLYSSRNLAGGFTTGLKDASGLFKSAVEIAQTSKTGNAAQISGALTSISAIVGSVAPDLASGLVQNVIGAAIGGNNDSIVALRSLAGVNAGNTAFLQALANDPQGIFVNMFRSLANMQSMSPENYMEVAEGLSSVFGVDMKAFARVDFNALANKISEMTISTTALGENMSLLTSGEATMSTEQMKLQEINNTILEEGLAYVIDSEAGRMIQQHMWEEQLANEIESNVFAVELQGSALKFLEGMRETLTNLLNFFNPAGFAVNAIANMEATAQETQQRRQDIADILQLGAVGANQTALSNLLTVGEPLGLTRPLIEMMGGKSNITDYVRPEWMNVVSKGGAMLSAAGSPLALITYGATSLANGAEIYDANSFNNLYYNGNAGQGMKEYWGGTVNAVAGSSNSTRSSLYSGFNVGKSAFNPNALNAAKDLPAIVKNILSNPQDNAIEKSNTAFQKFIDNIEEASKTTSWEDYKKTLSDYGLNDLDEALANYGKSEEQVRSYFEANQARHGALQEAARKEDEQTFRDETRRFWDYTSGTSGIFQTAMWLPFINDEFKPFFDSGARYDQRMDAVDTALSHIQIKQEMIGRKLGDDKDFTVISALTLLNKNFQQTFVVASSTFQRCLADWISYIGQVKKYNEGISGASAWSELRQAESDAQNETLLALANAMNVFSADELKKMDPQLQANALLGKIVIILEAMMQQQNTQAGGLSLIDTMSALGLGVTQRTP